MKASLNIPGLALTLSLFPTCLNCLSNKVINSTCFQIPRVPPHYNVAAIGDHGHHAGDDRVSTTFASPWSLEDLNPFMLDIFLSPEDLMSLNNDFSMNLTSCPSLTISLFSKKQMMNFQMACVLRVD